jgi:hypothetical protein
LAFCARFCLLKIAGHRVKNALTVLFNVYLMAGFGIEIDPIYVDLAISRWERLTGRKAQNSQASTFEQVKLERSASQ